MANIMPRENPTLNLVYTTRMFILVYVIILHESHFFPVYSWKHPYLGARL